MKFRNRLEIKILAVILVALSLGFGGMVIFNIQWQKKSITKQIKERLDLIAGSILKSFQTVMREGDPEYVVHWLGYLKDLQGIEELRIVKNNGIEAFRDTSTLEKINTKLGEERFVRKEKVKARVFDKSDPRFKEVLKNARKVEYYEEKDGKQLFTQLTPIMDRDECHECHDPFKNKVHGIIKISTSLESSYPELLPIQHRLIITSLITVIIVVILLIYLIQRLVVKPINLLQKGVEFIGKGNLDHRLAIHSKDVIGSLAHSFNRMAENLKTSKEMREKKEFLENILNNVSESVITLDKEGNILSFSKGSEEMFGFTADEVVGKNYTVVNGKRYEILEMTKGGEVFKKEVELRRKEGRIFPAHLSLTPLKDDKGQILGFVEVAKDLTEEKTKEKIHRELIQTEKMSAIGQLSAGITHDINIPLATIITLMKGLKRMVLRDSKADKEDFTEYLDLIQREIDRCKAITEKILNLSRKSKFSPQWVDLNKTLLEIVSLIEYETNGNNIKVVKNFSPHIPKIQADDSQLRQLFLNIILNGIQAIGRDGTLEIITRKNDNTVYISIKDTGCGIEEEDLGKIFEPFFTKKPEGKGTGLGLSVCENIVKQHGGKILVESQVGKGTKFDIILPLSN